MKNLRQAISQMERATKFGRLLMSISLIIEILSHSKWLFNIFFNFYE